MTIKDKAIELKAKVSIGYEVAKMEVKRKTMKALKWASDNPEQFVTLVSSSIYILYKGNKMLNNYKTSHRHDREIYDPRLQMWHPIKRELSYDEQLYYKTSVMNGRNAIDVLREMRLYK